jgi:Calx-beta domain/Bacterial Ig domain
MRLALPRAVPLVAVLAAFLGPAAVAHALPGKVAVFNNPNYVDNADTDFGAEGPNTIASLQSFGETVNVFTGITAADFTSALAGQDSLVIPEMETQESPPCLSDDMGADAQNVVKNFVATGGQLVVMSIERNTCDDKFLNDVFGFALPAAVDSPSTRGGDDIFNKTPDAAGTEFADGPASIPDNDGTGSLDPTTLPAGAKSIYAGADGFAAVVDIPFGDGSITLLGWDWFNSSPPNPVLGTGPSVDLPVRQLRGDNGPGQDFGWQDVLRRSVDLPVMSVSNVSVTEGNSGNTPAGFTVSASQNHSEVLHLNFGTANGTATAGSDYAAASGALTFDRSTLSVPVNVNVTGDTAIEPNETFGLGLAAGPSPDALAIGPVAGTGTIVNDDFAKPSVGVAGVRRACTSSSTVHVRFTINAAAGLKSVKVTLDGKRVATTTKSRFTVTVHTRKLKAGRHTITAVALDNKGQTTTVRKTIARCAAAKPRRKAAPRFTG